MRVVIVDDEPLARRGVRARPAAAPDMRVVAECATGGEALSTIRTLAPDLIFLDIQMPDLNGFDVLRRLPARKMPLVVFLTAYDQYALEAFEAQALDYLLKPIDDARFMRALERARILNASHRLPEIESRIRALLENLQETGSRPRYRTHLTGKTGRRVPFVSRPLLRRNTVLKVNNTLKERPAADARPRFSALHKRLYTGGRSY